MKTDRELKSIFAEISPDMKLELSEADLTKVIDHYDIPMFPLLLADEKVEWCKELIH